MIAIFTGSRSSTQTASSCIVIWKPASPQIAQTSDSGMPIWAPIAAGNSNPIVPRPPDDTSFRGLS